MQEKTKTISIQNDSFYSSLIELVHKKRLTFADAYLIKRYLVEEDFKKATNIDERVINYIAKNLKDWHILVTNTNASKIFLILREESKNNFNLCKILGIGEPTVHYWVDHLKKLSLVEDNEFNYGIENMWRRNDLFDRASNPADLVKEENQPPKDNLKLKILHLTAYFCMYVLENKSIETAKKKMKEDFSFLRMPIKKEMFLTE